MIAGGVGPVTEALKFPPAHVGSGRLPIGSIIDWRTRAFYPTNAGLDNAAQSAGRNGSRFRVRGLRQDMAAFGGEFELRSGDIDQIGADQFKEIDQLLSLKPDTTVGFNFQQNEDEVGG
jgi:hypothetical protein